MRRFIVSAVAVIALAAATASCASWGGGRPEALAGSWEGMGVQVPSDGEAAWPLRMVLTRGGDGSIDYPTLSCGGSLTRLRSIGNTVVYREVITHGAETCIEGGTITIVNGKGKLFWYWTGEGTTDPEVSAAAVLKRVGA